jgi:hypothetical protein
MTGHKGKRLCFSGFRPEPTVRGIFGDPKARVITLKPPSKNSRAAVAVMSRWAGTTARCAGCAICRAATRGFSSNWRCRGSTAAAAAVASYQSRWLSVRRSRDEDGLFGVRCRRAAGMVVHDPQDAQRGHRAGLEVVLKILHPQVNAELVRDVQIELREVLDEVVRHDRNRGLHGDGVLVL